MMLQYSRSNAMVSCNLRRAEPQDTYALAACFNAAYRRYSSYSRRSQMVANYAEAISLYQVWVALYQGEIIGGIILVPKEDHMQLANIAVHPDHQGKGIGRVLLALADSEAVDQGYHELRLHTNRSMTESIALYKRSGWVEILGGEQESHKISMNKSLQAQ